MRDILVSGAARLGIALSEKAAEQFEKYTELLESENQKMNLTAVKGEKEIAERHFLDSLGVLIAAGEKVKGAKLIDVGCGAGFPGLPMKIAEPTIRLTSLDSTEKRILFLRRLVVELDLEGADCVFARAEELSRQKDYRECFDFAVSRAVARLNMLSELCLPFVKVGGSFLAMKTASGDEEIKEAERAIAKLGGKITDYYDYAIMGAAHRIVVISKLSTTPDIYPRRFAKIQKQPL
jgi:16S rRNA (guanine527-N7)-methyltransferase